MNVDAYKYVAYVLFAFATLAFVAAVGIFFGLDIKNIWKDWSGSLQQQQIEEIRIRSSEAALQREKINVFEQLEMRAKPKRANTHSLNVSTTSTDLSKSPQTNSNDVGTSVFRNPLNSNNPNFIIEKNLIFVCTDEVL